MKYIYKKRNTAQYYDILIITHLVINDNGPDSIIL